MQINRIDLTDFKHLIVSSGKVSLKLSFRDIIQLYFQRRNKAPSTGNACLQRTEISHFMFTTSIHFAILQVSHSAKVKAHIPTSPLETVARLGTNLPLFYDQVLCYSSWKQKKKMGFGG